MEIMKLSLNYIFNGYKNEYKNLIWSSKVYILYISNLSKNLNSNIYDVIFYLKNNFNKI